GLLPNPRLRVGLPLHDLARSFRPHSFLRPSHWRNNMELPGLRPRLAVWLLVGIGLLSGNPLRAADAAKVQGSLAWVPERVAVYSCSMRNREQVEIILKSKAWEKFTKLPFVQEGWKAFLKEYENPPKEGVPAAPPVVMLAQFKKWYAKEENQELVTLIG